ncbi:hypothetical protein [Singulisphaera sp. PoT]|uniref:hypothetical protein n=1 Tax=Singulisphaera sp. PoT TaxID=3411797 RepID=UPI003BF4757F
MESIVMGALKSLFWNIAGMMSWSQWAVVIIAGIFSLSLIVNLPTILLDVLSMPLKLKSQQARMGYVAALALLPAGLLIYVASRMAFFEAPPAPPPPVAVASEPMKLPRFKLPDLSGLKLPDLSKLLPKIDLPAPKEIDPDEARRAEEARLEAEEARKAAEAKARALARKREIRMRNINAQREMDMYMASEWQRIELQEEMRQRDLGRFLDGVNTPAPPVVLPPGSRMVR